MGNYFMVHHLLPTVKEKLSGVSEHLKSVQKMADEEKSYPELMNQICTLHSELGRVEQLIVQDLAEHSSEKN